MSADSCDKCQIPGTYRAGRCSGCISESQVQDRARQIMEDAGSLVKIAREQLEQIPGEWTGDECGRIESEIAGTVRNLRAKAMLPDD
jgi:hypothetical protein